jgi:hypothetical protein
MNRKSVIGISYTVLLLFKGNGKKWIFQVNIRAFTFQQAREIRADELCPAFAPDQVGVCSRDLWS